VESGAIDVKLRFLKSGDDQHIERMILLSGTLDAEQRTRLLEIADKTPLTTTIAPGVAIHTALEAGP
jgi:putative redox protein